MGIAAQRLSSGKGLWRRLAFVMVVTIVGFVSLGLMMGLSPAWAVDTERAALRHLSKAFTDVAKRAVPAVVYIEVERTVSMRGGPFNFNDLFEFFGDEFFERFFGQRFPEGRQPQPFRQKGQGSGFIISRDGYILTNHHVVGEADRITVSLVDGRTFTAKLIGTDPKADVAVIQIEGADLPVLPLGDSDILEPGEWVVAVGSPFGLTHTVTVGVVSAKGRSRLGIADYEDFIQTDAAINPGNSGGPLLNLDGQVVGLNTAIVSRSGGYMGIGFAIPINMARAIQDQLVSRGRVVRGYLGVHIQDLTEELAQSFDLETTTGALIADVSKGSPAAQADLRVGDVIVTFDGKAIRDVGQLRNLVALTAPGSRITLDIMRTSKRLEIGVTMGELPQEEIARADQPKVQAELGLAVQELTPELAEQFGYSSQEGVLIADVKPDSPASEAGLSPGMLIRQVDHQAVRTTQEFQQALAEAERVKGVLFLVQDRESSRFVALRLG